MALNRTARGVCTPWCTATGVRGCGWEPKACIAEPLGPRSGRAVRTARRGVKSSRGGARGAGRASRRGVPARFEASRFRVPAGAARGAPRRFPRRDATWTITRARSLSCAVPVAGSGAGAGRAWAVRGRSEGAGSRGSRCRVSDRNRRAAQSAGSTVSSLKATLNEFQELDRKPQMRETSSAPSSLAIVRHPHP